MTGLPVGLAILNGVLRQHGASVRVFDTAFYPEHGEAVIKAGLEYLPHGGTKFAEDRIERIVYAGQGELVSQTQSRSENRLMSKSVVDENLYHIDNEGDIYVADWNNHRVQKFSPDGTHLLTFGSGKRTGISPDGATPYSHSFQAHIEVNPRDLNHPTGVAVDGDGDVYVVDWMNERVVIFDDKADPVATLRGDALATLRAGQTTAEEVVRVTHREGSEK